MENSSNKPQEKRPLKLKIDANVVRQLGEELISDPEQAILELVKNSYDADSDWCVVNIDTTYQEEISGVTYKGRITIEDAGVGMTQQQISKGWLTISYSEKRKLKQEYKLTQKHHRSYQGDKGLGRLSSMKLGSVLRLNTSTDKDTPSLFVQLNWDEFRSGTTLDNIQVLLSQGEIREVGTKLEIIGLTDLDKWKSTESRRELQTKLSSLISPFEIDENFKVFLSIDNNSIDLSKLTEDALKIAVAQFKFEYKNGILCCLGKVKLPYYLGNTIDSESKYNKFIKPDSGQEFYNFLNEVSNLKEYKLKKLNNSKETDWFMEFSQEYNWQDITAYKTPYESPGNFVAEWNYVFLGNKAFRILSNESGLEEIHIQLLKTLAGIGVYKGHFRVGKSGDDWLGLAKDKTAGEGFYSLRPDNTIGYFYFPAYEGESLKEKSDRQDFVENEAYNGFMSIAKKMIAFSNQFLNRSRRASATFTEHKYLLENNRPVTFKAEDAILEIKNLTSNAKSKKEKAILSSKETAVAIESAQKSIDSALNDLFLDDKAREDIQALKNQVSLVNEKYLAFNSEYGSFLNTLVSHEISADKIISRLEQFEKQIDDFYDFTAIGLAAQNLAHEINPQLDDISLNANEIKKSLQSLNIQDRNVYNQINTIIRTTQVIAKDVTLINPMLRSRRETIDSLNILSVTQNYIELRAERFKSEEIKFILFDEQLSINIKFNKGKFTQVIDNLVRNSEYWLNHFYKINNNDEKKIFIQYTPTGFILWDSGPGIREGMDQVLFEMFTTDKVNGQGLGLFITNKILNQRGCNIRLLDELNSRNRKYKFEIDMTGAISDGN